MLKNKGFDVKMNMLRLLVLTAILSLMFGTLAVSVFAAENGSEDAMVEPIEKWKFISMAIAVSIPSVGAGYSVARTGTAASACITEKPELFGRTIVYVGMAEGIAIYGLLISFLIWIS
ncbi:MAG: ATP synthase subunit C [Candidatus Hermodarchaeota archaeon]